jgi:hypothetical protein
LVLIAVWFAVAIGIARRHRRLSPDKQGERTPART